MKLVIGDKNYSSWSLRGWLTLMLSEAPFEEVMVPLSQPETHERLLAHSPSAKVPVLITEAGPIWDSLAIAEYLAERFPQARLWPRDEYARALARSLCAQMHSGFSELRTYLPMDLQRDQALDALPVQVADEIAQVCALWADCRARYGSDGPFLFGHASIVDAFYAPVAARFRSYRIDLPSEAAAYVETVFHWPNFQKWQRAALAEEGITA